jgi:hypothetical protein
LLAKKPTSGVGRKGLVGPTVMNAELEQWLAELRVEDLVFADDSGGANKNLWTISIPRLSSFGVGELVGFLLEAAAIRRELVKAQALQPITFYVWHDEMAGQLRFSTAVCTRESLPFGAAVCLVEHPAEIVRACTDSPYRDGIPWTELELSSPVDASDFEAQSPRESKPVTVWAERLI